MTPLALAQHPGDAGSGKDAGDRRAEATKVAYGLYEGRLEDIDADWFAADDDRASLTCVRADAATKKASIVQFGLDSTKGRRTMAVATEPETPLALAIATSDLSQTALGLRPATGHARKPIPYSFALAAQDVGATSIADTAAASSALAPGSCAAGALVAAVNAADSYSLRLEQGDLVWYSVAATSPVRATLTGPGGAPIAPSIEGDELAGAYVPVAGEYLLHVEPGAPSARTDYVVAATVASSEPPTNPCRPYCMAPAT